MLYVHTVTRKWGHHSVQLNAQINSCKHYQKVTNCREQDDVDSRCYTTAPEHASQYDLQE